MAKKESHSPLLALSMLAMAVMAVPIFAISQANTASRRASAAQKEKMTMEEPVETPSPSPRPSY